MTTPLIAEISNSSAGGEFPGGPGGMPSFSAPRTRDPSNRSNQATMKANIAMTCLFLAGIGCLYLLSLRGGPTEASAEIVAAEQQVNIALARIDRPADATITSTQNILKSLDYDVAERQIPVECLGGNPFLFTAPQDCGETSEGVFPEETASRQKTAEQAAEETALAEVNSLQLQSILTGPSGAMAVISNRLLREGDTVSGWHVGHISERSVTLTWKDLKHQLVIPKKASFAEGR